ncbi:MAG: S-layer homology domain-containing protein [Oscillospiraceae bacterium]|nr:S-layer homology domain-containing protein [Oscillospiraceae bacterium]
MRILKKLALFVVTLSALLSMLSFSANAEALTDVDENEQYYDAINTLNVIGLIKGYEDNTFRPWSTITRAEFTTITVRALNIEDIQVTGADSAFTDISEHYAKYNIKTAHDLGIINGFEDGTFRPDETVTYEQMLKMVVCTLGYGYNAEQAGGYPDGYIYIANQLGLCKGITGGYSDPSPRGAIAQLMYNALNVRMQQAVPGGYTITDDTLMNSRLNIKKIKIYVTGVEDEYIESGAENLQKGEMSVTDMSDNTSFIMDFTKVMQDSSEMKKYIGQILTVYYRNDDKNTITNYIPSLIAIDEVSHKNDVLEIPAKNITDYKNDTLYYDDDKSGRNKSVKIKPNDISLIYNGKSVAKDSLIFGERIEDRIYAWLNPDSDEFINGEIKIIDSEADNSADVVFITGYDVIVAASAVSSSDYKLSDKLVSGNNLILDPFSDEYTLNVTRNGKKAEITSIRSNDVVLIAESLDGELYTVDITSSPVTGSINEISDDEITIENKLYYMTEKCLDNIDNKKDIKVGAEGTFYIDKYNNIMYCSITKGSSSVYAYLLNITENDEIGNYRASVYAPTISSKEVSRIELKDKINFNGSVISADNVVDKLEDTASFSREDIENSDKIYTGKNKQPSANAVAQIVKIGITKNQISSITTIESGDYSENTDDDLIVKYRKLDKYKYSSSNNFDDKFYINSSTKILYVPGERSSKSDYAQYSASSIFKSGESYWVEPYDVNDKKVASLVIMYGNSTLAEITKDTPVSVITKSPILAQVNDDNVYKLTMYMSTSTLVTKNSDDDKEFADLEAGDVIQFGYDNNGRATNRHDVIRVKDVLDVIENDETLSWTDDKFNHYYTENGDIIYDSSTDKPYSRVFMANVSQVIHDDDDIYIHITQDGFDGDVLDTDNSMRYEVSEKTPVVKYNISKETVSAYIDGTTTKLNVSDLKDAENNGTSCSKIMVYLLKDKVQFIMMYE